MPKKSRSKKKLSSEAKVSLITSHWSRKCKPSVLLPTVLSSLINKFYELFVSFNIYNPNPKKQNLLFLEDGTHIKTDKSRISVPKLQQTIICSNGFKGVKNIIQTYDYTIHVIQKPKSNMSIGLIEDCNIKVERLSYYWCDSEINFFKQNINYHRLNKDNITKITGYFYNDDGYIYRDTCSNVSNTYKQYKTTIKYGKNDKIKVEIVFDNRGKMIGEDKTCITFYKNGKYMCSVSGKDINKDCTYYPIMSFASQHYRLKDWMNEGDMFEVRVL